MIALLFAPKGVNEFTISQGHDNGSTTKIYAVLLHDGFWRVTSAKDPEGTDYRIHEDSFVMRNQGGRQFKSQLDKDVDWSNIDFAASTASAPFKHPSMGSTLEISREVPGLPSAAEKEKFLVVRQKDGWVKGFLISYSTAENTTQ